MFHFFTILYTEDEPETPADSTVKAYTVKAKYADEAEDAAVHTLTKNGPITVHAVAHCCVAID